MSEHPSSSGLAAVNGAQIYYEMAGSGTPFVMIHAGVADHRQWDNEFAYYAHRYRALRYDLRGYGDSEPVEGEYSNFQDMIALLDYLKIDEPAILMGCSMGGGLAMTCALERPERVKALILVDSGPPGLELETLTPPLFEAAEQAYEAGDLDRVAEIETRIWFDGPGRAPDQVDPAMRRLAYAMNRKALDLEARGLGKRLPDSETSAAERLGELALPALIIVGEHDIPYIHAAAEYMLARLPAAQQAAIADAAHLPNLDHPAEFRRIVDDFLEGISA